MGVVAVVEMVVVVEFLRVVVNGVKECLDYQHFFAFVSFSSFLDKNL